MENYLALAAAVVVGMLIGAGILHYVMTRGTSTKEQALKVLDKAAAAVAAMSDPGPDEQVAIAARVKREELLQASIAASMAKVSKAT